MFSPEEYTHFKPGWGIVCIGIFVATFMGVVGVVRMNYPDKPSVERGFEGGLDRELGGKGTIHVSAPLSPIEGKRGVGLMFLQARTEDGLD